MGIEPGPNGYELGDPCPVCWGLKTPKRFLAIITGVNECPGALFNPTGFWIMSQVSACVWANLEWPWRMYYNAIGLIFPVNCFFTITDVWDNNYFGGKDPNLCTTVFNNDILEEHCGGPFKGWGGSVGLYFGPGI